MAHPEGNGQAEATNKLVLKALQKDLEGARGKWQHLLPKALWAVRTAIRGPTGEIPFALTYGSEALAPVKMGLPTLRVATYNPSHNQQNRQADLDYLEEKRLVAQLRAENYKRKTKLYHDSKLGYWVLLDKKAQTEGAKQPKLEPSWEGPYQVGHVTNYNDQTAHGLPILGTSTT